MSLKGDTYKETAEGTIEITLKRIEVDEIILSENKHRYTIKDKTNPERLAEIGTKIAFKLQGEKIEPTSERIASYNSSLKEGHDLTPSAIAHIYLENQNTLVVEVRNVRDTTSISTPVTELKRLEDAVNSTVVKGNN